MRKLLFATTIALALSSLGALAQSQGGVSIAPLYLNINARTQGSTAVTLRNTSGVPIIIKAQVVAWSQATGKDVYEPSRNVLVNPAQFTLAPGQTQIVRVGFRSRPAQLENAYRVVVEASGLSGARQAGGEGLSTFVNTVYRFGLPLFVSDPDVRPRIQYRIDRQGEDLLLTLSNTGNGYQALRNLQITNGTDVLRLGNLYALSGSAPTVLLEGWGTRTGSLTLAYQDQNEQEQRQSLDLPRP